MGDFKGGPRGPKREGGFKGGPRREGGFARKPRAEGFTPRAPREEGAGGEDRPKRAYSPKPYGDRAPRPYGDRPARPYGDRPQRSFDRKPREDGEGGERPRRAYGDKPAYAGARKPYGDRASKPYGDRAPRPYGDRPARPYGDKPYTPRAPREDGEGGERPRRAYGDKPNYAGARKPYGDRGPRSGFGGDRKPSYGRSGPREGGFGGPREGGFVPRSRAPRTEWVEKSPYETAPNTDGWLVGKHAVTAAIVAGRRAVKEVLLAGDEGELAAFTSQFPNVKVRTVNRKDLDERFRDQVHQGIAAEVGNLPQPTLAEIIATAPRLMVALDQVTDPHNFGAVLRSCAAFGVAGVVATERRSAGVTSVVAKAAAGALEIVPVVEVTNLVMSLKELQDAGYTVIGLEGEVTETLADLKLTDTAKVCIVLGSEGEGLRRLTRETCNHLVRIPMGSAMESLNVSVAAGVILSQLYKA